MDVNKLRYFYFAAKAHSFNKTELNISPSVISRHVADLESYYNVKLFHRTSKGLVLTQTGQSLFKKGKFLISFLDQTEKEIFHETEKHS